MIASVKRGRAIVAMPTIGAATGKTDTRNIIAIATMTTGIITSPTMGTTGRIIPVRASGCIFGID